MNLWCHRFYQNANQKLQRVPTIPQIREQISVPETSWYGKSILGCGLWPGLDSGEKRVWADYEQLLRSVFFTFSGSPDPNTNPAAGSVWHYCRLCKKQSSLLWWWHFQFRAPFSEQQGVKTPLKFHNIIRTHS